MATKTKFNMENVGRSLRLIRRTGEAKTAGERRPTKGAVIQRLTVESMPAVGSDVQGPGIGGSQVELGRLLVVYDEHGFHPSDATRCRRNAIGPRLLLLRRDTFLAHPDCRKGDFRWETTSTPKF
jgi:hypothetical protein